jgi:hypothetical protein
MEYLHHPRARNSAGLHVSQPIPTREKPFPAGSACGFFIPTPFQLGKLKRKTLVELCTRAAFGKIYQKNGGDSTRNLSPLSHPRLHFHRTVGQRDAAVGSLICILGLAQAINLRSLQALPGKGSRNPKAVCRQVVLPRLAKQKVLIGNKGKSAGKLFISRFGYAEANYDQE